MTDSLLAALAAAVSSGALLTDPAVTESYRYDRAATAKAGRPVAVVRANDTADVQATLRIASQFDVAVVTRGAGTGLSGGSAAAEGGITLSTERLRHCVIDPGAMTATVGPGLLNVEVKAAAAQHGLWYPPDPSSFEICSIGGNLATNAGGLCCVKYGVTTDYVLGLEVVLADGRLVRLGGRTIKDVAGYDLKRLMVGSEGTLGVITEATLRLRPAQAARTTVVGTFADVAAAGDAVTRVMAQIRPAALELMDNAAVLAVEKVRPMGLDAGIDALLLAQSDVGGDETAVMAAAFEAAGATYVVSTEDAAEGEAFLAARRMAIPCVERLGTVMIEDISVPVPEIPKLLTAIEGIAERRATRIPVIGHAGDGNFHPLVTFDASDTDAASRAMLAFGDVMDAALELGGTITGEHGVGTLKAEHLVAQLGSDVLDLSRRIKQALDPQGILNPGKWV